MCKCLSHQDGWNRTATQPGVGRSHRADTLSSPSPALHLRGQRRQTTSFQIHWEGSLGYSQNQHSPKGWVAVLNQSVIWCVGQCVYWDKHLSCALTLLHCWLSHYWDSVVTCPRFWDCLQTCPRGLMASRRRQMKYPAVAYSSSLYLRRDKCQDFPQWPKDRAIDVPHRHCALLYTYVAMTNFNPYTKYNKWLISRTIIII